QALVNVDAFARRAELLFHHGYVPVAVVRHIEFLVLGILIKHADFDHGFSPLMSHFSSTRIDAGFHSKTGASRRMRSKRRIAYDETAFTASVMMPRPQ